MNIDLLNCQLLRQTLGLCVGCLLSIPMGMLHADDISPSSVSPSIRRLPPPTRASDATHNVEPIRRLPNLPQQPAAQDVESVQPLSPNVGETEPEQQQRVPSAAVATAYDVVAPAIGDRDDVHRILSSGHDFCRPMSAESNEDQHWHQVNPAVIGKIELPPALVHRVEEILRNATELADRGAIFAARREFLRAMRMTARSLDSCCGMPYHSRALVAGLRALEEADDFSLASHDSAENDIRLSSYIQGHRTPVLKDEDLPTLTPVLAMQRYYEFAREQLSTAGGKTPLAARALYSLGRAELLLHAEGSVGASSSPKSLAFFHAALSIDPDNPQAGNELGVLMARRGHLREACSILQRAAHAHPTPVTLQNLAMVYDQLGDPRAGQLRHRLGLVDTNTYPELQMNRQPIVWVAPDAFRAAPGDDPNGVRDAVPVQHQQPVAADTHAPVSRASATQEAFRGTRPGDRPWW